MALIPGECQACGCTDERACPGGCVWANAAATLCSRCAQQAPELAGVELLEPDDVDDFTAPGSMAGSFFAPDDDEDDEIPW